MFIKSMIRWCGCIKRINENRTVNVVFENKLIGVRKVGRLCKK